jgi:hypothetical protein
MLGEAMHNYPEGYEEKPWCPNTKLVEICASLAGVKLTPQTFCTEELSNAHFSDGAIHWLKSGDFFPRVSCVKINRELIRQMEVVDEKVEAPSEEDTTRKISEAKDMSTKSEVFELYKQATDKYEKRKAIVDRWRKVVFETSVSTASDEKNEHFRQFNSADELSEDEIFDKVVQFTLALNKITGYEPDIVLGGGGAINCPKSPEHHHYGSWND